MLKPAKEAKKGIYCQFSALENTENAEEEKASLPNSDANGKDIIGNG